MKLLAGFFLGAVAGTCALVAWEYRAIDRALDSAFRAPQPERLKIDYGQARIAFEPYPVLALELLLKGRDVTFEGEVL